MIADVHVKLVIKEIIAKPQLLVLLEPMELLVRMEELSQELLLIVIADVHV